MDKIGVYISAFNAEATLEAALNSIIGQTYLNIDIYIGENGSSDKTFEIVKEYCEKYEFITCYRRVNNFTGSFLSTLYGLMGKADYDLITYYKYDKNGNAIPNMRTCADWLCFVDSDDVLKPTYLEEMLAYAKSNELDMVMCGWDFVRPNKIDPRIPLENEVIEKKDFAKRLTYYDKFMGPIWNKLFRYESMSRNITYYEHKFSRLFKDGVYFYGADTAFNYLYLGNQLEKFGILAKSLYSYHISDESVSRKHFHPMRIVADRRMAEVRFDFLQGIGQEISEENRSFIMNIYYKSIKATIDLLLHDERYELEQQMKYLHDIFSYKMMAEAFPQEKETFL